MELLIQFLLRLTFGLALGMAITSPKLVSSGYYRNHLYVTLGLSALAALLAKTAVPDVFWYAVSAAVLSYIGSVIWLYEKTSAGVLILAIIAIIGWLGASAILHSTGGLSEVTPNTSSTMQPSETSSDDVENESLPNQNGKTAVGFLSQASVVSSGALLGFTMAAMLLGHWYLNSPGMQLRPLRKLIVAMSVAVGLQAILSALGLWGEFAAGAMITTQWLLFVVLRWTFGIVGVAVMALMAWKTLDIPNTQSATGILYVAVIGTFVGETMALLLSSESLYPL